ncbi:MAG: hypothetical protein JJD97_00205, partial [Gemmatimonadaceae bacterium]|nr:hypothetical protein [Gemmatimonadaceae bacterium]
MLPLLVLLAIGVHLLLPQIATIGATAAVLQRMHLWAVALAFVAQAASYWANGYTIQSVARLTGDTLGAWRAIRLALAAGSVGLLAGGPVGYGAATFHWMRRRAMSHDGAVLCGWLPGIMNTAVLIAISIVGTMYLVFRHLLGGAQLVTLGILGIAVAALVAFGARAFAREERFAAITA